MGRGRRQRLMAREISRVAAALTLQQIRFSFRTDIGKKAFKASVYDLDADLILFHEDDIPANHGHLSYLGLAIEDERPCLSINIQHPLRVRLEVNALEGEVATRDQLRSDIGQTPRPALSDKRRSIGCRDGHIDVKLAVAPIIE